MPQLGSNNGHPPLNKYTTTVHHLMCVHKRVLDAAHEKCQPCFIACNTSAVGNIYIVSALNTH